MARGVSMTKQQLATSISRLRPAGFGPAGFGSAGFGSARVAAALTLLATISITALGASPARADRCDDLAAQLKSQIDGLGVGKTRYRRLDMNCSRTKTDASITISRGTDQ